MEHQFKAPCLPCVLHYLNMGEKKSRNCISNKRRYVTKLRFGCCCLFAKSCPTLLQPQGLQPTRFLCPWDFSGKNTEVGCHFLLQGTFQTQGWNLCLLHGQADSLPSEPPGKPKLGNNLSQLQRQWLLSISASPMLFKVLFTSYQLVSCKSNPLLQLICPLC